MRGSSPTKYYKDFICNNMANINPNPVSSASQCGLILEHLMAGKTITTMGATQKPFNCYRLSGRIHDLRERGYDVKGRWIVTSGGKRVTEYYMDRG